MRPSWDVRRGIVFFALALIVAGAVSPAIALGVASQSGDKPEGPATSGAGHSIPDGSDKTPQPPPAPAATAATTIQQNPAAAAPAVSSAASAAGDPAGQAQTTDAIIAKANEAYLLGEQAFAKGETEAARKFFDQALDAILQSGIDTTTNRKLETYYHQLLDRIHKHEAAPGDDHQEVTAPSPLDELSSIKEADLATVMPEGVKIYGKYDFDFSVAAPVLQFMNFFIAGRGHSTMEMGLTRSGRYREMAERVFREEHVPVDLIWLAQAESVWKPNALSRAMARGIWQFVPGTGTRFGLAQTAWVDERSNPEKSTRAAAQYLRFLHEHFGGDWMLAMAAYNAGENRVDEAISRCGYADFWELHRRSLLPGETQNYVPVILAIIIISKNQQRYGFNPRPEPAMQFETFQLPSQTDLKVVAESCSVPFESVQDLNPELRRGVSPPGSYTIRIPKGTKKAFEAAYANLPEDQRLRHGIVAREEEETSYRPVYHTKLVSYQVRNGDTLASLSRRYGVSVTDIARLNRLSSHGSLRRGQTVRIPMKASSGRGYREERVVKSRFSARRGRESSRYGRSTRSSHSSRRRR